MKDRYLFKAKRLDCGEWVEGNLIRNQDHSFIVEPVNYSHIGYCLDCDRPYIDQFDVIPETVCQYTGLTDKKGNKIWESDICKIRFELPDEPLNGLYEYHNCKIFWDEERLKYVYGDKENTWDDLGECLAEDLEVIGNIFNNPELLEVEDE